jgi:hypothetical protein
MDVETVKSYAQDLGNFIEEADFTQSKIFLRSFVRRITMEENKS